MMPWILNGYDEWDIQQHYAGWVLFTSLSLGVPAGPGGYHCRPGWHRHFVYRQHPLGQHLLQGAARGCCPPPSSGLGGTRCSALPLRGEAGAFLCARGQAKTGAGALVFSTLGGLLLLCCLPCGSARSAIPRWPAGGCFAGAVCLSGIPSTCTAARPNSPGPCRCWPLAVGIHPYFLPLVMMCALLAAVELGRQKKAWGRAALQFAASLAAAVVGGVLCGAIGSGTRGIPLRLWRLFHEPECTHQPNLPRGLHLVPAVPGNAAAARPV